MFCSHIQTLRPDIAHSRPPSSSDVQALVEIYSNSNVQNSFAELKLPRSNGA